MGNLSDIARVTVSLAGAGPQQASFNKILIVDYHTRFAERVRAYSSLDGMISDSFDVDDAAYKAAAAAFSQNPAPLSVLIGRRALAPDLQIDLAPVAANSTLYEVEIVGPTGLSDTVEFTSDAAATVAEIVAGLVAAINTAALGVTATNVASTHVRLKAGAAGLWFACKVLDRTKLTAQQTHADPGIAADLAAIKLAGVDFYAVTLTTAGKAEIVAAAAWVESAKKLMITHTQDGDTLTAATDDVMSTIQDANQFRSKAQYSSDLTEFAAVAWLARVLGFDPGNTTFEFHQLAGVTTESLTDTEALNLRGTPGSTFGKAGSAVLDYGGLGLTVNSVTAGGEWLDIIRDRDWFEARLQGRIVTTVANASAAGKKIPFTDKGAATLEADLRAQLDEGIKAGFLADDLPAPVVNIPAVSSISTGDRALRKFGNMTFSARVAGAIHLATITGFVSP